MAEPSIATYAQLAGIASSYRDVFGEEHRVENTTIHSLLVTMGFDSALPETLERLKRWHAPQLPPTQLLAEHQPLNWRVVGARGGVLRNEADEKLEDIAVTRGRLILPALGMGYYTLTVEFDNNEASCRLIVAPEKAWEPDAIDGGKRLWGIAAQLYGLHGNHSMGIGDFSDLTELARNGARRGADVIGLNPMHAMFPNNPAHCSPYSPSNRLFLNPLYLDPRRMKGFNENSAPWNDRAFKKQRAAAQTSELVDYPNVSKAKFACFEALYTGRQDSDDEKKFREAMGPALEAQARFDALSEVHGSNWHHWPHAYQNPASAEVGEFAQNHAARVDFFRWLYWQADRQCEAAQAAARKAGMEIGLYRDLAVGPDKAGAEMWRDPSRFMPNVSVGAPPDELNPNGQNWGLPAFHPFTLRELGYAPFIELLRANMRHARALRIDHAFGLSRLFLIPDGGQAGAYVHYPFLELLAVLKIESHRNRCLVIGEDLGTFPPGYKERAAQTGIYSYKVLYFERDAKGFIPPDRYPSRALATLSTHDLPTLAAWESSADIEERRRLRLYPSPELEQRERNNRPTDKQSLAAALAHEGLENQTSFEATQRFLARSPASIVMLQLEDLLGLVPSANLPGTTDQRPNWRMKLPASLRGIDTKLATIAPALNEERAAPLRRVPRATYRLQFHKDFTFYDAAQIVPYLAELGISHVYASPYFTARPGSTHGYDITDHNALNPELGGEEGYRSFCTALRRHGLQQLLDFVPNHMGIGSDNRWWLKALEWGQHATEASYFDIDWAPRYPGAAVKLLLPVLGNHYGDVLDAGEITVTFDPAEGSFSAWYFTHRFPICPCDYAQIDPSIAPTIETVEAGEGLKAALAEDTPLHASRTALATRISQDKEALHALLERQHYRLAYWRVAASDINYRRFFDINDLAGLRVEDPAVFDKMHERVLALVADGTIAGLRIDHIDGLADPAEYLTRLREQAGAKLYLTVEKILGPNETLPPDWPCDGTSGYDALNQIAALFIEPKHEQRFDRIYRRFAQDSAPFATTVRQAKALILETSLASEWRMLALSARRIAAPDRLSRDYPYETLKTAIRDIITEYPVYRAYGTPSGIANIDRARIAEAVSAAKRHSTLPEHSVYDFIGGLLDGSSGQTNAEHRNFERRFQQVTGPVMAKGLEDTSFYRYVRLLALNDVGGDPAHFGTSIARFHRLQQAANPHSMIATATHDTKRGEDARMRLASLSEHPREWLRMLLHFERYAKPLRRDKDNEGVPSAPLEYFIYQTLLASWPLELMAEQEEEALRSYKERIHAYLTKALREGKRHSNWNQPDEAYEQAVHDFIDGLLAGGFLAAFLPYAQRFAKSGACNSLVQLLLKMTLPGVPDIYQGCEYWDFSFVDPDNRRPVDYAAREHSLDARETLPDLLTHWQDGQVKQQLLHRLLLHRRHHAALYRDGDYQPIAVKGKHRHHVLAFRRNFGSSDIIVVAPIRTGHILANVWPLGVDFWGDTRLGIALEGWVNLLTDCTITDSGVATIFGGFPGAVLVKKLMLS